jgi:predicted nucleic acid-binding OB-fold protein
MPRIVMNVVQMNDARFVEYFNSLISRRRFRSRTADSMKTIS